MIDNNKRDDRKMIVSVFFIVLAISVIMFFGSKIWGAIHQPNDNIFCARAGCGHRHYSHTKGQGACEYVDIFTPEGHCEGWVK